MDHARTRARPMLHTGGPPAAPPATPPAVRAKGHPRPDHFQHGHSRNGQPHNAHPAAGHTPPVLLAGAFAIQTHMALCTVPDWQAAVRHALGQPYRGRQAPVIAVMHFVEGQQIEATFGRQGRDRMLEQAAWIVGTELSDRERVAPDGTGGLLLLLRGEAPWRVQKRLEGLVTRLSRIQIKLAGRHVAVTPLTGWTSAADGTAGTDPDPLVGRATAALDVATRQLDLIPRRWRPTRAGGELRRNGLLRTTLQWLATVLLGLAAPFGALVGLYRLGLDLSTPAYLIVTTALVTTAVLIWVESMYALDPTQPPAVPASPYPPASAIIPAYLPNEADTIIDTVRAFLAQDYPGPLQIILAYNTPHQLPIEAELHQLARLDPRLVVLRVPFSTSKAQNVNAALRMVNGEFTGVFDADHQPVPDAFSRAWRWLSHGVDVVQGHCVIRNGSASWLARTVAVEFESMYAVSHPGRAKLHGFGLFGGSNGFWRTRVLHETRMHPDMLTEDIDSSIRVLLSGRTVVNDPALVSRELAPTTLGALWGQRMRWAQGWFQVTRRHLVGALRSGELSLRNKIGIVYLLGWREIYPWLSLLMAPVVAFLAWRAGGVDRLDWTIPLFLLTTLYTLSVGPVQILFAWRLAAPEVRRHGRWFWLYLLLATVFYTELKNHIARIAQLKDLCGERRWVVTPRQPDRNGAGQ